MDARDIDGEPPPDSAAASLGSIAASITLQQRAGTDALFDTSMEFHQTREQSDAAGATHELSSEQQQQQQSDDSPTEADVTHALSSYLQQQQQQQQEQFWSEAQALETERRNRNEGGWRWRGTGQPKRPRPEPTPPRAGELLDPEPFATSRSEGASARHELAMHRGGADAVTQLRTDHDALLTRIEKLYHRSHTDSPEKLRWLQQQSALAVQKLDRLLAQWQKLRPHGAHALPALAWSVIEQLQSDVRAVAAEKDAMADSETTGGAAADASASAARRQSSRANMGRRSEPEASASAAKAAEADSDVEEQHRTGSDEEEEEFEPIAKKKKARKGQAAATTAASAAASDVEAFPDRLSLFALVCGAQDLVERPRRSPRLQTSRWILPQSLMSSCSG